MVKVTAVGLLGLLLGSCAFADRKALPYDAWSLNFFAPPYMEAWIEMADAVDINNYVFRRAGSGGVSTGYPRAFSKGIPEKFEGNPIGWDKHPGGGGRYVWGADLPRLIYVRWQSLVEPQTYEAYIKIPELARTIMSKKEIAYCGAAGKWKPDYRELLVIGLAPGGAVKVWVAGPCLPGIEVTSAQGTIVAKGPYGGKSDGEYYFLSDESKAYIDKFGIPFGSW